MKNLVTTLSFLLTLTIIGCSDKSPEPEAQKTTPTGTVRLTSRDTITTGNYRGIEIGSDADVAFAVLEKYRLSDEVSYISAVNNYFGDIKDIKNRIHLFENISFDEKPDTESGVQLTIKSGRLEQIYLNNRRGLSQWPETLDKKEALLIGDDSDVLYEKLVAISRNELFAYKFEKVVLTTRTNWALYNPERASWPWHVVYKEGAGKHEEIRLHFQNKELQYITVNKFESN